MGKQGIWQAAKKEASKEAGLEGARQLGGLLFPGFTLGGLMTTIAHFAQWWWPYAFLAGVAVFVVVTLAIARYKSANAEYAEQPLALVEPQHIIFIGLAGIIISAALTLGGVVWQMRQPKAAAITTNNSTAEAEFDVFSGKQFTPTKTPHEQPSASVLLASRYYSAQNKEEVAGFLDKISGTINKTGDEMLLLAEKAIDQFPWDRPGENIEPFVQQMDVVITKAAQIHAALYDDMLANEREYRVEMNAILFPQEPFINFQNTAKACYSACKIDPVSQGIGVQN